jgi:D-lyxose ketol-isomerase
MKRSEINRAFRRASRCFSRHKWALPPRPRWDITDFGLGRFDQFGLVLVNLATEPEYCEKLMYARRRQTTPAHTHKKKKEDIICRAGRLTVRLWPSQPDARGGYPDRAETFTVPVDGRLRSLRPGARITLAPGSRVTLVPGIWHAFWPASDECIIGEVSTANDDLNDNFFADPNIGRFPGIEEDEKPLVRLVSE